MRRKKFVSKLLSVMLSAAVIVTSSFGGLTLVDVDATEVTAEETVVVSDNSADTQQEPATEETVVTDEAADDNAAEEVADEPETKGEDVSDTSEDSKKGAVSEDIRPEKAVDKTTKVSSLVENKDMDANIAKVLLHVYNESYNGGEDVTEDAFTLENVWGITGVISFDEVVEGAGLTLEDITSAKGLGYANQAQEIDLGGTSVKIIPDGEFYANGKLETIVLPDSLEGIQEEAFKNCTALVNIHTYVDKNTIKNNTMPSSLIDVKVGSGIFAGCTSITTIKLPECGAALQFAKELFMGCSGLKTVTIPATVTVLPESAFVAAGVPEGMTVVFETDGQGKAGLVRLMSYAFAGANITQLDLSACTGLEGIDPGCFSYAGASASAKLKTLVLPNTVTKDGLVIGTNAFNSTPITDMYVKEREIEDAGKVVLPDYVISLGEGAFYNNTAMEELRISANLPRINAYTFDGCANLGHIEQSTVNGECKIISIGDAAFRGTSTLDNANFLADMNRLEVIGDSVGAFDQSHDDEAFSGVKPLEYGGDIKNNVVYGSSVFEKSKIQEASFPASLRRINLYAFWGADNLKTVTWASEPSGDKLEKGEYVIDAGAFYGCTSMTKFLYPKTENRGATFKILGCAFYNCVKLTDFYANDANLTKEDNAFPVTTSLIGQGVFLNCDALEKMRISNNEEGAAPEIWMWVFMDCSKLTSVELPSKLTYIPLQMFHGARLQSFPTFVGGENNKDNSIKTIGKHAFFGSVMSTMDLSALTSLERIEEGAFAYVGKIKGKEVISTELALRMDNKGEIIENKEEVPLQKVILPSQLNHTNGMRWGDKLFMGAAGLTTVAFSAEDEGTVCIPNYVKDTSCGKGVFALTSVSEVHWQYTDYLAQEATAPQANRWSKIPASMFLGTEVESFKEASIPQEDLVAIGPRAYAYTKVAEVDFSDIEEGEAGYSAENVNANQKYSKLETIDEKAFYNCYKLAELRLPDNEVFTTVGKFAFAVGNKDDGGLDLGKWYVSKEGHKSALSSIDFGSATTLGEESFSVRTSDGKLEGAESSLENLDFRGYGATDETWEQKLDLPGDSVTTISKSAFAGHGTLARLDLGRVVTIGANAFELCTSLCLTDTPMSDSVDKIGEKAFYKCTSLGEVTFGSGLASIGKQAFSECYKDLDGEMIEGSGLTKVDFGAADELSVINASAFARTAIEEFDVSETKLKRLQDSAIKSCPYLVSVKLGPTVQMVEGNAMAGCIAMQEFEFYSSTIVSKSAFESEGEYKDEEEKKTTPIDDPTFRFKVYPVELNIGVGGVTPFPFYVNLATDGAGTFGTVVIGSESNASEDLYKDIYKHVKLIISHSDNLYYKNTATGQGNQIAVGDYYEQSDNPLEYTVSVAKIKDGVEDGVENKVVSTFGIEGLKATPEPVPFSVTCGFKFKSKDRGVAGIVSKDLTAKYSLNVMEVPYYPTFYLDANGNNPYEDFTFDEETLQTSGETVWEVPNGNAVKKLHYRINCAIDTNWKPQTANLIIESSNPAVAVAKTSKEVKELTASSWKLTKNYSGKATDGSFEIKPTGAGDAVITIYHEDRPNFKTTWKIKVKPDISNIKLSVPEEYKKGVQVGNTFSMIESVENCLKQKVSRKDGNLANLSKISDNVITYKSDNPAVASIDANGNVKIHKVTTTKVKVTFTATVKLSTGATKDYKGTYDVVYPPISTEDPTVTETGETVQVTKKPTKNDPGEAVYVAPKTGATAVVIPATMMVNGYPCKVTEVSPNAFSGNTTITSVSIGKNVTKIGKKAFYKCTSLQKVTLPKGILEIGTSAFSGCKALTTVSISSSAKLTKIGNSAFANCSALTKITIPKKVTSIGSKAFYNCKKLKKINVKSKVVTKVGKNAFKGIYKKAVIDVPNSKKSTYKKLFKKGQGKKVKIK